MCTTCSDLNPQFLLYLYVAMGTLPRCDFIYTYTCGGEPHAV